MHRFALHVQIVECIKIRIGSDAWNPWLLREFEDLAVLSGGLRQAINALNRNVHAHVRHLPANGRDLGIRAIQNQHPAVKINRFSTQFLGMFQGLVAAISMQRIQLDSHFQSCFLSSKNGAGNTATGCSSGGRGRGPQEAAARKLRYGILR